MPMPPASPNPSEFEKLAANARDAVDAEVIPEHMTAKAMRKSISETAIAASGKTSRVTAIFFRMPALPVMLGAQRLMALEKKVHGTRALKAKIG